jgi:LysM domain
MTEFNEDSLENKPVAGLRYCPHLGMADDPDTQFVSPDIHNTCFKAQPPNRVSMRHQARVCLTSEFRKCKMYQAESPVSLPRDLQGKVQRLVSWGAWVRSSLLAASLLALLVLTRFAMTKSFFTQAASAASTPVVQAAVLPQGTETLTKPPAPTVIRSSSTPQPSDTPQVLVTEPMAQSTPGPALETPFGGGQIYLVHMTLEGETLDMLAARYETSVAVLQVVNLLPGQQIVWANRPLVVLPGRKDADGLSIMQALQVEENMNVADLAVLYGVDEADFRQENGLMADQVPAGRWLVLRAE